MTPGIDTALARAPESARLSPLRLFFDLFKLRIGLVIGFTAAAGAAVTPGPEFGPWGYLVLAVAVTSAAAAAGAFNQLVERDLDSRMGRTRHRPFVTGRLVAGPRWIAAILGIGLFGVALAGVAFGLASAFYTLLGALTYGVVYTVWLKRRTRWNIVIGGLAGSFAVLAGAAAVVPDGALGALPLTFAIVLFLWTPPHFWSLAIAYRADYEAARIPMLPVIVGNARTARIVHGSTVALVAASLAPAFFGMGWVYLVAATGGGGYLLWTSSRLAGTPSRHRAMANFHATLIQLSLLLVAAVVERALHG